MPNIISSVRSVKTDELRRSKNAPIKAALRNAGRKVVSLTETGVKEEAQEAFVNASSLLDKAARKNIVHKKAASRKKSRLAKRVNAMD